MTQRAPDAPEGLYLDLLKRMLTRHGFNQPHLPLAPFGSPLRRSLTGRFQRALARRDYQVVKRTAWNPELRLDGRDRPTDAETMIGMRRLDNLQECIVDLLRNDVRGDLVETGVWRGGATIFMRGVLKAYGSTDRVVWVADSFQGLPKPDAALYPEDEGDQHWTWKELAVSLEDVQANFAKYCLLDDQVQFLPGWFRDTLPSAPIERLALLRLDGDMYESTIIALRSLYPKLSPGGYVVVDDYGAIPGCRAAVDDYRAELGITDVVREIDWTGVFWEKLGDSVPTDSPAGQSGV